jgi:hypothetical protein
MEMIPNPFYVYKINKNSCQTDENLSCAMSLSRRKKRKKEKEKKPPFCAK